MPEVTINYKDAAIATMDASGTKTLQTQGKYCEDDIEVVYARPSAPSGTKQISITQNGTIVEDVAAYANAEITVNVQGGGGLSWDDIAAQIVPDADVTITGAIVDNNAFSYRGIAANEWKFYGPNVTYIGQNAFRQCPGLTEIHLPILNDYSATGNSFINCAKLKIVDYGVMSPVRGVRSLIALYSTH